MGCQACQALFGWVEGERQEAGRRNEGGGGGDFREEISKLRKPQRCGWVRWRPLWDLLLVYCPAGLEPGWGEHSGGGEGGGGERK